MDEFAGFYSLVVIVLLLVLLYKFDKRYGKIEYDIDEIKKRLNDLSKPQEKVVIESVKAENSGSEALAPNRETVVVEERREVVEVISTEDLEAYQRKPVDETVEALIAEPIEESVANTVEELSEELIEESIETSVEEPVLANSQEKEEIAVPVPPNRKQINYEKFIGENLFGKIGILIFVLGIGFFVKYAIDKDWINETMRTVLGFLVGSGLLAVAERLQKKYRTFSSLLAGGAFAVFYLTVAIAFHYYHLFSQTMAFVVLIGVTIFMSILSILYDRRELAITSLVGGFLAPFIVSSGEGSYVVLFTYLSILNLGMFGLSIYKKWSELPIISFIFTYLVVEIYLLSGYNSDSVTVCSHLFMFATLFYFIFLLPVLSILRVEEKKISRILLSIVIGNNFFYLGLGVLFLQGMNLPFKAEGILSLFIAIVNLGLVVWLRKSNQDYKFLIYSMLGLVLTFVSITVPIQLNGNYITLFWASEMVLLLWLYIKSKIRVYEYASFVLVCLTLVSFMMDISNWIVAGSTSTGTIFLNSVFITSLYMGLATGAFALLIGRNRSFFLVTNLLNYKPWNAFMLLMSVIIIYSTFIMEFYNHLEWWTANGMRLVFTAVSLLLVGYAFRKRFPITKHVIPYLLSMGVGVLLYLGQIWWIMPEELQAIPVLLQWIAVIFIIANIVYVSRLYYVSVGQNSGFVVYLNVLATILWLGIVRSFLCQVGVDDFSAGFSLALGFAGLIQMGLGMRLHQKQLRVISLVTFGIVLLKLALIDLWALPTIGKIIVFIMLGAVLLILSFLYQKLKDVLFKNDEDEVD